jgi:methionyl-tRNA synthetase
MENLLNNVWVIVLFLLWSLPWKGLALWKSARRGQLGWFVVLLFVNTLAILDIIYLMFFSGNDREIEKIDEMVSNEPVARNKYTKYRELLENEQVRMTEKVPAKNIKKIM